MKMTPLRCTRCGSTEFLMEGSPEIFIDIDAALGVKCRNCLAKSTGTLIDVSFLEFVKDDIDE